MFRLALRRVLPKEMRVVCEFCRLFSTDLLHCFLQQPQRSDVTTKQTAISKMRGVRAVRVSIRFSAYICLLIVRLVMGYD